MTKTVVTRRSMWLVALLSLTGLQLLCAQNVLIPDSTLRSVPDDGTAGYFGWSTSISTSDESGFSWLAVSKPWDNSVHIFSTTNPSPTRLYGGNTTAAPKWKHVLRITDTFQSQVFGTTGYSYFGWSVSLSADGAWLAVGIPGRISNNAVTSFEANPYNGCVRLYRRHDSNVSTTVTSCFNITLAPDNCTTTIVPPKLDPNSTFSLIAEIPNTNAQPHRDHFGSKVILKARPGTNDLFLFTNANAGWDKTSARSPVSIRTNSGVYVYRITDYNANATWMYGPNTNIFPPTRDWKNVTQFLQFIPLKSVVPLGTLGIDFDVLEVPETQSLTLLMRDYIGSPRVDYVGMSAYVTSGFYIPPGTPAKSTIHNSPVGAVVEYTLNLTTWLFTQSSSPPIMSYNFTYDKSVVAPETFNYGYGRDSSQHNDWFGVGIASVRDASTSQNVVHVGAPRAGDGSFIFTRSVNASGSDNTTWTGSSFVQNPAFWRRTYFGGKAAFKPNGDFLIVSDANGTPYSNGNGVVYLYYRRIKGKTPTLYPEGLDKATLLDNGYDLLGTYQKSATPVTSTVYWSDYFGASICANNWFVIIAAAADNRVHSYSMPQVDFLSGSRGNTNGSLFNNIALGDIGKNLTVTTSTYLRASTTMVLPANTTTVGPESTLELIVETTVLGGGRRTVLATTLGNPDQNAEVSVDNAWLYAVISAVCVLAVLLPAVGFVVLRHHKRVVIERLKRKTEVTVDNMPAPTSIAAAQSRQEESEAIFAERKARIAKVKKEVAPPRPKFYGD